MNSPAGLIVRSEPDTGADPVRVLAFREQVDGKVSGGWLDVGDGYVSTEYLSDVDPVEDFTEMGTWSITAYAETGMACANGEYPEVNYTVACNSLPFGTEVYIEGAGFRTVEDRGPAAMGSEWIDIYMQDTGVCIQWGQQYRKVWVVE